MDAFIVISLIKVAVVFAVLLTTLAYLQWVERKVIAHIQVRPGPYNVGPHGLLQPLADVIKLITKEDLRPPFAHKALFLAAPFMAMTLALMSICVIPFGPVIHLGRVPTWMQLTDLNIGVLFVLAVSSMGVYGVAFAGWASNNKYALLGGLRSSAQMISYELPLSIAIASPLLLSNTLSLRKLVESQAGGMWHWNVLRGPFPQVFSFIIFLIAAFAETNRIPFDLPEAENELVAGFHTEYSGFRWALYFLAEYANIFVVSSVAVTLFWGGWLRPFPSVKWLDFAFNVGFPVILFVASGLLTLTLVKKLRDPMQQKVLVGAAVLLILMAGFFVIPAINAPVSGMFWFLFKVAIILYTLIWFRGTFPRFRYDQLMNIGWKIAIPVGMAAVVINALLGMIGPVKGA